MKTKLMLLISIFALLLGACAASQRSAGESAESGFADQSTYAGAPAAEPVPVEAEMFDTANNAGAAERIVIREASLEIVVDSPDESMQAIGEMAEEMGGFIVSANLYQTRTSEGAEVPRAAVTIRVPAERLDEALARIEAESDRLPLNKNINSQDVTRDYTDLQSRLTNLEAAEAQLVEILESANRTEDVLNVFEELTRVREQIEVLQGQILYYENSAKLSAVRVELIPNEAVQPISIGGWEPVGVVKDAVQTLIVALQGLVNIGIWIALFILPILLIVGIPLFLIIRVIRNRRQKSKKSGKGAESGAQSNE